MPTSTIAAVDQTFIYILTFAFLLFALIIFFMLYFTIRYRRSRNPEPTELPGNALLEGAWITASVILALSMFWFGLTGFRYMKAPPADSLKVGVTARQWTWLFTYTSAKKSSILVVPEGRDIELDMRSLDVIHGFFVPAYRIKMDVLPTMVTRAWFKAETQGSTDILCTQYCGLLHSRMRSRVVVVPPADFQKWLAGEDVTLPSENLSSYTPGVHRRRSSS
jgi:cytochrome c oxidase subunit II